MAQCVAKCVDTMQDYRAPNGHPYKLMTGKSYRDIEMLLAHGTGDSAGDIGDELRVLSRSDMSLHVEGETRPRAVRLVDFTYDNDSHQCVIAFLVPFLRDHGVIQ